MDVIKGVPDEIEIGLTVLKLTYMTKWKSRRSLLMSKLTSDQNPTILKKVGFQQQAAACIIKLSLRQSIKISV